MKVSDSWHVIMRRRLAEEEYEPGHFKEYELADILIGYEERLAAAEAILAAIKKHWQQGIGDLHNSWRLKMAELVGDEEGLLEAAQAAKGK